MKKIFKTTMMLLSPLVFVPVAHRSIAQSAPMDIRTAVYTALTNNRSVLSDSLAIPISEYRVKELAGYFKPHVSYSSSTEYNPAIPSQMLPGSMVGQPGKDLVPVQFGTNYNFRSGMEVTQSIYRKDLALQVQTARVQTKIAQAKYKLSKEELVYHVAASFYALQAKGELIRTTAFDYSNLKEVLAIAKAQHENGTLKRIDYETLVINVANKQTQLNQLETQYKEQLAYFNYLVGIPAFNPTIISDSLYSSLYTVNDNGRFLQREDIRLANYMIESKEKELQAIRAEKSPSISSYFRYSYHSQFNKPGKAFDNDHLYNSSTVGITVSIPIFDGHRRKNRINAAMLQLSQLQHQSEHKQDQARMEVVSATGTLDNNQRQLDITKRNLALAEKVFISRMALYAEGVTTLIELLDAERELSSARDMHIQSLIDVQTSQLNWHKANGSLLSDFIESI